MDPDDYLRELCVQGVKERYGEDPSQGVMDRLDLELGITNPIAESIKQHSLQFPDQRYS